MMTFPPTNNPFHEFEQLLREFEKRSHVPGDRTFLELGGFPHYERVISNFLAFFLDPNAEHKMGDMVLRAISNLLNIPETLSDVLVETEFANIDILVSSASHVIAIENKIYHHADSNPFASYVDTVRSRFRDLSSHFIVLTPFPAVVRGRREELAALGYVTISYNALFTEIRAIMGAYAAAASNRHWLLLIDLIKTIENISMGSNFDRVSLDFFENNATTLSDLLQRINAFRAELRAKVVALHDLLKAEHPRLLDDERLAGRGAYYRENEDLFFDTFYVDVAFSNGALVGCDVIVRIGGWEIRVIPRGGRNFQALKNLLTRAGLSFEEATDRFVLTNLPLPQGINGDLGMVADVAVMVIGKLKGHAAVADPGEWVGKSR
jgi:hypothetical protein